MSSDCTLEYAEGELINSLGRHPHGRDSVSRVFPGCCPGAITGNNHETD
jgi:hypothetical protein